MKGSSKKMKKILSIIVIVGLIVPLMVNALPASNYGWIKTFGGSNSDYFTSMTEVSDGFIAVGRSMSTDGDMTGVYKSENIDWDGILIKYDYEGNVIWKEAFGGTRTDYLMSATEVSDGYVAVGYSQSTDGDMTGLNKGSYDGFIVKYDTNRNIVWTKTFGGSSIDRFDSIIEVSDGYIAVGASQSTNGDMTGLSKGNYDAIIVKYDMSGNVVWVKTFGGSSSDYFESVIEISDGYIAVGYAGSTNGDMTGLNKGWEDAIIVKYDTNGNVVWAKTFGGTSIEGFSSVTEVSNGYIAVGTSHSTDGDMTGLNKGSHDGIIVKYDYEGNVLWKKSFGGSSNDIFYSLIEISDGYIVVGNVLSADGDMTGIKENDDNGDGLIVKYNTNGEIIWAKTFGGSSSDGLYSLIEINNGYIAMGYSFSNDGDMTGLNKGISDGVIVANFEVLADTTPNPETGDNIIEYIVIILIGLIGILSGFNIFNKKRISDDEIIP